MYKLVKALVKKPGGETWQKSLLIGYNSEHPGIVVIKDENDNLEYEITLADILGLYGIHCYSDKGKLSISTEDFIYD